MKFNQLFRALVFCCLSACMSSPPKPITSNQSQSESFLNGEIRLNCKISCSRAFGSEAVHLNKLYKAGLWHELARKIYEIDFNIDIAYFYLGRAAEGLGKIKAAEKYYLLSQSAWTWCIYPTCQGLSFPDASVKRLNKLKLN